MLQGNSASVNTGWTPKFSVYKDSTIVHCMLLLQQKSQSMEIIAGIIILLLFDVFLSSWWVNIEQNYL